MQNPRRRLHRAGDPGPLAALAWLNGCWTGSVNGRDFREQWSPVRGNTMIGVGHTIAEGQTQDYEYLRLEVRPDGVFYIALPSGEKEAFFKLTSTQIAELDTIFTFTNSVDAFPQRIVYRRATEGWLYAIVEGKLNGERRKVVYPHAPCRLRIRRVPEEVTIARANFERMLAAGTDNALLRFSLGQDYLNSGDAAIAATHLERAVQLDEGYTAAWKLYARALRSQDKCPRPSPPTGRELPLHSAKATSRHCARWKYSCGERKNWQRSRWTDFEARTTRTTRRPRPRGSPAHRRACCPHCRRVP